MGTDGWSLLGHLFDRNGTMNADRSGDPNLYVTVLGIAYFKASCSHGNIVHNQSALNKATEALKAYLDKWDRFDQERSADGPPTGVSAEPSTTSDEEVVIFGPDNYGPVSLGMTQDQVQAADPKYFHMTSTTPSPCTTGVGTWGRLTFGTDGKLYEIAPDPSINYHTPEGLRVGDPISKAVELYGDPVDKGTPLTFTAAGSQRGSRYHVQGVLPHPDGEMFYYNGPQSLGNATISNLSMIDGGPVHCFN